MYAYIHKMTLSMFDFEYKRLQVTSISNGNERQTKKRRKKKFEKKRVMVRNMKSTSTDVDTRFFLLQETCSEYCCSICYLQTKNSYRTIKKHIGRLFCCSNV